MNFGADESKVYLKEIIKLLRSGIGVGGETDVVTSTVTMSVAGAYVTGDYIGTSTTPQCFPTAVRQLSTTGIIKSIRITDKSVTAAVAMELWIFNDTFVAPTDNAAWAITDTEANTCLAVIPISTTKWYASSNNKVYFDDTLATTIKLTASKNLYYALVARGSTPTWATGDLTIGLGILQD